MHLRIMVDITRKLEETFIGQARGKRSQGNVSRKKTKEKKGGGGVKQARILLIFFFATAKVSKTIRIRLTFLVATPFVNLKEREYSSSRKKSSDNRNEHTYLRL